MALLSSSKPSPKTNPKKRRMSMPKIDKEENASYFSPSVQAKGSPKHNRNPKSPDKPTGKSPGRTLPKDKGKGGSQATILALQNARIPKTATPPY